MEDHMAIMKHGIETAAALALQCMASTLALTAFTTAAFSQTPPHYVPTMEAGRAIAQKFCSSCHLTPDAPTKPVTVGIPSLSALANKPQQTPDAITLRLISPPHPMPDMQLTRDEIADVIAYLAALRTSPLAPPWKGPSDGERPKYPRPP
jgi:cytochrome c